MPSLTPDADLDSIVQDLQFLSKHGQGPAKMRAEIQNWADCLAQSDPYALQLPLVKRTIAQLICLAYASAAFQRSVVPPFYRGPVALNVEDTGGYFLARSLVTKLVRLLPFEDDEKMELVHHALAVDDRHRQSLERLLPIA